MQRLLASIFFLFLSVSLPAQTVSFDWARSMGSTGFDYANTIDVDGDGNVYTAGAYTGTTDFDPGPGVVSQTALGLHDIFVQKLDNAGLFIWVASISGTGFEEARSLTLDTLGNVYITGRYNGTVDFDPGPMFFNLTSAGSDDIFICKLDSDGNFLWAKSIGGAISFDVGNSIHVDLSGNVYTTGFFTGTADFDPGPGMFNLTAVGSHDGFISKLDTDGNFLWAKHWGGANVDFSLAIDLDAAGNIFTTGHFRDTADFDPGPGTFNLHSAGDQDVFISKLDAAGDFIWAKRVGGSGQEGGQDLAVDGMGNVISVGYFEDTIDVDPGPGLQEFMAVDGSDILVLKLDPAGNFIWAGQMGGPGFEDCAGISIDATGDLYMTGIFADTTDFDPGPGVASLTASGMADAFIAKWDAAGNFDFVKQLSGDGGENGLEITVDDAGNIYSAGLFQDTVDFDPDAGVFELGSVGNNDIYVHKLQVITTQLNTPNALSGIRIFPSPTSGTIHINLGVLQTAKLEIVHAEGKLIQPMMQINSKDTLELSGPPGVYVINVYAENSHKAFRLIKQ